MERWDVNATLGPSPTGGPIYRTAEDLMRVMDRLGIARALVRHTEAIYHDPAEGNAYLSQIICGQDRLEPCWVALPPVAEELGALQAFLAAAVQGRVRAMALYPAAQGYPLSPWMLDGLLGHLAERHMILLIETAQATWEGLHGLCGAYPGLRVIVLETGYRVLRPLMGLLTQHENLYVDISTMTNFYGIETLCRRFGSGRLLLGTGGPRTDGAGVLAALSYAEISETDRQAICAHNLARLLAGVQI